MSGAPSILQLQVVPNRMRAVAAKAKEQSSTYAQSGAMPARGSNSVRRPTRGIMLKEDTFATLRLVAGNGKAISIVDAGSRRKDESGQPIEINGKRATDVYSNFLLQTVQEERQEKQQILETFGEAYIFLFGERARVMNFQGILANTWDFNWEAEWWWNYENYLRGTRCVENDAQVFLSFDQTIVGGYIIAANAAKTAQDRNFVNFQFSMFVTYYSNFSDIGNPQGSRYPWTPDQGLVETSRTALASPAKALPTLATQNVPVIWKDGSYSIEEDTGDRGISSVSPYSIKNAWLAATTRVQRVLGTINGIYSGSPVRVPVGFEGSFAYDDADQPSSKLVEKTGMLSGVVRYGAFSDNDDEYVGSGDHYGTAVYPTALTYQSKIQKLVEGVTVEERARKLLAQAGYVISTSDIDTLATAVRAARLGIIAFTTAKNLTSYRPPESTDLVSGSVRQDSTFDTGATVDPAQRLSSIYQG